VDKIFVHKAKEAENTGSNAIEQMNKWKAILLSNPYDPMISTLQQVCLHLPANSIYLKRFMALFKRE
jgi:hypothetical protein